MANKENPDDFSLIEKVTPFAWQIHPKGSMPFSDRNQ
jgi:hypothetical protein